MNANHVIVQRYGEVVSGWRRNLPLTRAELAGALADCRIYFAYNSDKIENPTISYHDTSEAFESGRALRFVHPLWKG